MTRRNALAEDLRRLGLALLIAGLGVIEENTE